MKKEFTKADLKSGMVVEYSDKTFGRRLVVDNFLVGEDGYLELEEYNEDLTLEDEYATLDIVSVYKVKYAEKINKLFDKNNLELIWERKETKEMTVEEMQQKLEDLTGDKIEVKASEELILFRLEDYCNKHNCNECVFGNNMNCKFHSMTNCEIEKAYKEMMQHEYDNGIK